MGDMGDYYRDWDEIKKRRKAERMEEFDPTGWTKVSEWHYYRTLQGKRLDYWPSTGKFRHGSGRTMHGDVNGFIRNRLEPNPVEGGE